LDKLKKKISQSNNPESLKSTGEENSCQVKEKPTPQDQSSPTWNSLKENVGEKIGQAKEKVSQVGNPLDSEKIGEKIGEVKEKASQIGDQANKNLDSLKKKYR